MKPTVDKETFDHLGVLLEFAEEREWPREFDDRYRRAYRECPSCATEYWDNGIEYRDKNGHDPYHQPEHRKHGPGCRLAASLKFMRAFLRVEGQLHQEAEDAEEAA